MAAPATPGGPTSPSLASRSLSALGWNYVGAMGRLLSQLVIQVALARILGPEAFGQATAAMIVLGFGWLLADAGFGAALVQKRDMSNDDVGYALGWVLVMSVLMCGAIASASGLIANLLGHADLQPLVLACAALIPLQALSNIPANLLRRQLEMKRLQMIQVGTYIGGYGVVGLFLAKLGMGAWSLIIAFAVQSVVSLALMYACVRHTLRPRLVGDRALRQFGLRVMATNMANWAIDNLDRMVVSHQWGSAALGEYSAASNLSRAPAGLLVSSVQSVVFSSASKLQEERERLVRGFLSVLGLVALLSFPLFTFLALHAELIVHMLYGNRWHQAATLFAAFCVSLPFYAMLAVTGPVLWSINAVGSELKVQLFTGVCIVAGLWALSGLPLSTAVWIIPALYAVRVALVYAAFARRVQLAMLRTVKAVVGGILLALVSMGIDMGLHAQLGESIGTAVLEGAVTVFVSFALVRARGGWLLPPELSTMLRNRSSQSTPARMVCRAVGI